MKCIVCGFENPDAGKLCTFCGKPLVERPPSASVATGATAAAAAVAPEPPPPPAVMSEPMQPEKSHKTVFIVVAVSVAICVMVFLGFVGLGFFGYFVQNQQKAMVGRLAHEAVNGQSTASGSDGELQSLIRDYFKQIRDLNVSYRQQVADLNLSQFPKLYTAETFATPDAMRQAQSEIVSIWKVDSDQEDNLRALQQKMRDQINSGSWSDFQKKAFTEGFDTGAGRVVALREPMVATEKDWVDAASDLYQYAMDNAASIQVQNGHIAINDADIRDTFNQKMNSAEDKYRVMQSSKQSYDQQIAQMTSQTGLSKEDFRSLQGQQ